MERSSSSKKCGYVTSKGTKCKNPSESCRFHCKKTSPKSPKSSSKKSSEKISWMSPPKTSPSKPTLKKGRSTPTTPSPKKKGRISKSSSLKRSPPSPPRIEKGSQMDLLNNMPLPVLHQTLLKVPRDELNEVCKAASKMRRKGITTNIEKICREERFQKEYSLMHPMKRYPLIFDGDISVWDQNPNRQDISGGVNYVIIKIDKASGWDFQPMIIFTHNEYFSFNIWKEDGVWFTQPTHPVDSEEVKKYISIITGRPDLFSVDDRKRGKAVESLLRQIVSEVVEQYQQDRIFAYPFEKGVKFAKNLFKKFGV